MLLNKLLQNNISRKKIFNHKNWWTNLNSLNENHCNKKENAEKLWKTNARKISYLDKNKCNFSISLVLSHVLGYTISIVMVSKIKE